MVSRSARSFAERVQTRLARLDRLVADEQLDQVLANIRGVWSEGSTKPDRLLIRREFSRRLTRTMANYHDRRTPSRTDRPSASRLISPRGAALQLELVALFAAQCHAKAGSHQFPLRPAMAGEKGAALAWSELVAVPTTGSSQAKRTYATRLAKRGRQIKSAIAALADPAVRLAILSTPPGLPGHYDEMELLAEVGALQGPTWPPYHVPKKAEECFSLPLGFFLNGWQACLTDSEVALLLAIYAKRGLRTEWSGVSVQLDAETRIRQYGLGPDVYASHRTLQEFGLLAVESDENRRSNGTVEGYEPGATLSPHKLSIIEAGFERRADEVVRSVLPGVVPGPSAASTYAQPLLGVTLKFPPSRD